MSHTTTEDLKLLALIVQGSRPAFEALYHRHAGPLFRYFYHHTFGNQMDSEELLQELFITLWQQRARLGIVTQPSHYIYSVARHALLHYYRSGNTHQRHTSEWALLELTHTSNEGESNLYEADLRARIEQSIASLPERCQQVFRLSRYEHLPIAVIAERLNISKRTVESYITDALKHLRTQLKKER